MVQKKAAFCKLRISSKRLLSKKLEKLCMGHKLSQLTFLFSSFFEITAFSWRNYNVFEKKSGFYKVDCWVGEGGSEGGGQPP